MMIGDRPSLRSISLLLGFCRRSSRSFLQGLEGGGEGYHRSPRCTVLHAAPGHTKSPASLPRSATSAGLRSTRLLGPATSHWSTFSSIKELTRSRGIRSSRRLLSWRASRGMPTSWTSFSGVMIPLWNEAASSHSLPSARPKRPDGWCSRYGRHDATNDLVLHTKAGTISGQGR
jgi:hypothetical protein